MIVNVPCMFFSIPGAQPILYPAETIAAAYHTGRPVHTGQGLALSSSRFGPYSTVAGASGYASLAAPSGTLSAAATTAGTLQPLSHVPSAAQSSQFHYIANTGVQHPHGHSVVSPGSHSFSRSGYSQVPGGTMYNVIPAQPGTLQLQPSVTVTTNYTAGYHNPVISTSAPAYTQQQPQLSSIHPATGTPGISLQPTLPIFTAPDTFSSHQLPPQQVTQPQQTRPQWNAPSGY